MIKQYRLRDYNFRLVIFLIGLTFTGVLLVGSAEPALRNKQFFGMMLGVAIMLIVSLMDFSWILNFTGYYTDVILYCCCLSGFLVRNQMVLQDGLELEDFSFSRRSFQKY